MCKTLRGKRDIAYCYPCPKVEYQRKIINKILETKTLLDFILKNVKIRKQKYSQMALKDVNFFPISIYLQLWLMIRRRPGKVHVTYSWHLTHSFHDQRWKRSMLILISKNELQYTSHYFPKYSIDHLDEPCNYTLNCHHLYSPLPPHWNPLTTITNCSQAFHVPNHQK